MTADRHTLEGVTDGLNRIDRVSVAWSRKAERDNHCPPRTEHLPLSVRSSKEAPGRDG